MTVYVDDIRHYPGARWTRKHWCHMVGPLDELHAMAFALGLMERRLHAHRLLPHYDLTEDEREHAIALGAVAVTRRELVALLRRERLRPVLDSQREAIDAIRTVAARIDDWDAPTPCTQWRAVDLSAHLRATAARYLSLVSAPDLSEVVVLDDLAARNQRAIDALPPDGGPAHVAAFVRDAMALQFDAGATLQRWPDGRTLTGADLARVAVVEWHVHAWDLARSAGIDHRPSAPEVVAAAWRASIHHLPLPRADDPWAAVLAASGRTT